jgi:hypothetical protein
MKSTSKVLFSSEIFETFACLKRTKTKISSMGIIIGTISTGTIHEFKSQAIKTKFFIIGVPLFPVGSFYKLTNNMGIPVALNGKSVWVGYSRTTLLAIGFLLAIFSKEMYHSFARVFFTTVGMLLIINGILQWIRHWELNPKEQRVREILSQVFDYNMLPDYLSMEMRATLYTELLKKYNLQFPGTKWENEIANNNINEANAKFLFSLSYFSVQLVPEGKYKLLFDKIDNYLLAKKENEARS